jgi:hypothetical protein
MMAPLRQELKVALQWSWLIVVVYRTSTPLLRNSITFVASSQVKIQERFHGFLVGAHFLDEYEESSKPLLAKVSVTGIECSCKSGSREE